MTQHVAHRASDEIAQLTDERDKLKAELREHERQFDLRWAADQRAIKRWQAAHPGNDLVWPDHADLVIWLMAELTGQRDQMASLRRLNTTLRTAVGPFACLTPGALRQSDYTRARRAMEACTRADAQAFAPDKP